MKFFKNNLKAIIGFVVGVILAGGIVYAATSASQVIYTTNKNIEIKSVADALNDLYKKSNDKPIVPLIPKMTSNTSPSGEAKASKEVSGYEAYKAFDGNIKPDSDYWSDNTVAVWSNPTWLQYKFPSPVCAKMLMYRSCWNGTWYVKDFQILASNDETNWTTLYEGTHDGNDSGFEYINLNNSDKYLYYRMNMSNSNAGNMTSNYFQLFGY